MEDDPAEDITLIEARIEALGEAIERCRKFSLAAKLLIAAGVIYIALAMLALMSYTPETTLSALAAIILGIVLLGSNSTTWAQTEASLRESEAMRADIIGRLELRVVDDSARTVH